VTRVSVPGPDPVRRASFGTRLTFRSLEPTRGSRAPVSLQLRRSQRLVRRLRGLRAVGEPDGRRARPRVCVAVARPAADRACGAPSAPRRRLSLRHRQQSRGAGRRRAVARPVCCSPGNAGLARRRALARPARRRPPARPRECTCAGATTSTPSSEPAASRRTSTARRRWETLRAATNWRTPRAAGRSTDSIDSTECGSAARNPTARNSAASGNAKPRLVGVPRPGPISGAGRRLPPA